MGHNYAARGRLRPEGPAQVPGGGRYSGARGGCTVPVVDYCRRPFP